MKNRARMIIALVAGIVFILLQAIFPELPFTENQVLVFAGLIGAYILGEGLEGGRIADNLKTALKSHKFQALIAGLIVIGIKSFFPNFPLTEEQLQQIIAIFGALIIGTGIEGVVENVSPKG